MRKPSRTFRWRHQRAQDSKPKGTHACDVVEIDHVTQAITHTKSLRFQLLLHEPGPLRHPVDTERERLWLRPAPFAFGLDPAAALA